MERSFVPAQSDQQVLRPAANPATALRTVAELTGASPAAAAADLDTIHVTGIEQRSNAVLPGDLFAGLAGAHAHGARFAHDAVRRGAVAIFTDPAGVEIIGEIGVPVLVHDAPRTVLGELSSALYGDPSRKLRIVGITGTSGKTTTSYLVEAGLAASGLRTALIGTIETRIGGARVPSALTTPEAPQLHAMFAVMVEQGVDAVVMEVSSHALALGRVDGVRFDVGAFTNLSQDHLDFHSDFEDYFAAKRRLFVPDGPQTAASARPSVAARTSIICVDDEWGRRLAAEVADDLAAAVPGVTAALPADHPVGESGGAAADSGASVAAPGAGASPRLTTVATRPGVTADWRAEPATAGPGGTQVFAVSGPGVNLEARLRLPGAYNIANGLLALAICAAAGADIVTAAAALAEVDVPGRMQRVDRGQDFLAVVDYAHKPAAIESVVATLRTLIAEQGEGRLAVVVGAGGDRDAGKRPLMGAAGARGADLLIITDDNPRSEDPAAIRAAVHAGAEQVPDAERAEVREVGDRATAIETAVDWARPGDVVLVAGKGHETGQEISGVKHPFDDREVLAAALSRKTRDLTHS
ncbi:UDP-N-acetylmuramoyl-L-alanyl-D-glutamate--2,6-diaminopimelate ligase [Nocardia huaxiensis]|uniref:UDP-N-acetylmuramoyl-L-alanyl-D-glutamate--2,6-diaminopimelate ligase n=1 Tax=Nocardia huaxiensis TaxID=2755382 RepID=A0A7D6ZH76_9NOCA|nr:UDP-N-acetylmuramoyl-L-alanyl-D-glutamate--2,6-diaminopimelate ligase [Nocardia huaxiensis]QLY33618.1 UDP-N-acetylmuramoyl-L-alanyl-D-glutamate--2,6-diaminopimelate ligase [Nocardia huaxiensis]